MLKELISANRVPGLSVLRRQSRDLLTTARAVRDLFTKERKRAVTVSGSRAYVEYRGISRRQIGELQRAVSSMARAHGDIEEAFVNPFTRRVVMRSGGQLPPEEDLLAMVRSAEQTVGTVVVDDAPDLDRVLPDEPQLGLHYAVEAAADAMALVSGMALRFVPAMPKSIGANLYSALFVTSIVPAARRALEQRFGKERAELFLHMGFALALGAAGRPLTSLVALVSKVEDFRELRARRALWTRWADALTKDDAPIDLDTLPPRRPLPVPDGPIERYRERVKIVAASAFGFSLLTTRNPVRAVPAAFAALPFPAQSGREFFVAEIGRVFARRGMLVLSHEALRRLDRIDCLVIPADLVSRDQFQVGDAFALDGIEREEALRIARRLFHSEYPLREHRDGDHALGPLKMICSDVPPALDAEMRERTRRGSLILGPTRVGCPRSSRYTFRPRAARPRRSRRPAAWR
jgi:cation-transporting ATPase I